MTAWFEEFPGHLHLKGITGNAEKDAGDEDAIRRCARARARARALTVPFRVIKTTVTHTRKRFNVANKMSLLDFSFVHTYTYVYIYISVPCKITRMCYYAHVLRLLIDVSHLTLRPVILRVSGFLQFSVQLYSRHPPG